MPCAVRLVIIDLDSGDTLKAWTLDNVDDLVAAIDVTDPLLDVAYAMNGVEPMPMED
jgi:hypothetical protein